MQDIAEFPQLRMRRLRKADWKRRLVQEHTLSVSDLIFPVFVREDHQEAEVNLLAGCQRYTVSELMGVAQNLEKRGVPALILFPYHDPKQRTQDGVELLSKDNLMCRTIRKLKESTQNLGIIVDLALDPYSAHGQDGIVRDGQILNDETSQVLADYAVLLAEAGADIIAPSDMMDGRIGVVRKTLDTAGHSDVSLMSYSAKYSSTLYSPFRDALGSLQCLGQADKKTYQMNPANIHEALREVALDIKEGADMIIIKPGLPYLDVLAKVKEKFCYPTYAYHVSGEHMMLKAAAEKSYLDYEQSLIEIMLSFKRAGADGIITYAALDVADILEAST